MSDSLACTHPSVPFSSEYQCVIPYAKEGQPSFRRRRNKHQLLLATSKKYLFCTLIFGLAYFPMGPAYPANKQC